MKKTILFLYGSLSVINPLLPGGWLSTCTKRQSTHENTHADQPLIAAATNNNYDEVITLLTDSTIDINARNTAGETALIKATWRKHISIVRLLLDAQAQVEIKTKRSGLTALHVAASYGDNELVSMLLAYRAQVNSHNWKGETPLMEAAYHGHLGVVKLLLGAGAQKNLKNNAGCTALMGAALNGHHHIIQLLMDPHTSINEPIVKAESFFHHRSHAYRTHSNRLIPTIHGQEGQTILMLAAQSGDQSTVQLFIDKGAQINTQDAQGNTALIHAAHKGNSSVIATLLKAGAEVNTSNYSGETALMAALSTLTHHHNGAEKIIHLLLQSGADVNKKNDQGENVIIQLLYEYSKHICPPYESLIKLILESRDDVEYEEARAFAMKHNFKYILHLFEEHSQKHSPEIMVKPAQ